MTSRGVLALISDDSRRPAELLASLKAWSQVEQAIYMFSASGPDISGRRKQALGDKASNALLRSCMKAPGYQVRGDRRRRFGPITRQAR